jgi:hypothetical protein
MPLNLKLQKAMRAAASMVHDSGSIPPPPLPHPQNPHSIPNPSNPNPGQPPHIKLLLALNNGQGHLLLGQQIIHRIVVDLEVGEVQGEGRGTAEGDCFEGLLEEALVGFVVGEGGLVVWEQVAVQGLAGHRVGLA